MVKVDLFKYPNIGLLYTIKNSTHILNHHTITRLPYIYYRRAHLSAHPKDITYLRVVKLSSSIGVDSFRNYPISCIAKLSLSWLYIYTISCIHADLTNLTCPVSFSYPPPHPTRPVRTPRTPKNIFFPTK